MIVYTFVIRVYVVGPLEMQNILFVVKKSVKKTENKHRPRLKKRNRFIHLSIDLSIDLLYRVELPVEFQCSVEFLVAQNRDDKSLSLSLSPRGTLDIHRRFFSFPHFSV